MVFRSSVRVLWIPNRANCSCCILMYWRKSAICQESVSCSLPCPSTLLSWLPQCRSYAWCIPQEADLAPTECPIIGPHLDRLIWILTMDGESLLSIARSPNITLWIIFPPCFWQQFIQAKKFRKNHVQYTAHI